MGRILIILLLLSDMGASAQPAGSPPRTPPPQRAGGRVGDPGPARWGAEPGAMWREAPEFLPLFAPAGRHMPAYRAYVSPLDLDTVLVRLQADASLVRAPGSWRPRALPPLDAFGQTGAYDRGKVARLYGARTARVARGPRAEDGRVVESWTLIAPYPDTTLQRLERGTLLIVLKLP